MASEIERNFELQKAVALVKRSDLFSAACILYREKYVFADMDFMAECVECYELDFYGSATVETFFNKLSRIFSLDTAEIVALVKCLGLNIFDVLALAIESLPNVFRDRSDVITFLESRKLNASAVQYVVNELLRRITFREPVFSPEAWVSI